MFKESLEEEYSQRYLKRKIFIPCCQSNPSFFHPLSALLGYMPSKNTMQC